MTVIDIKYVNPAKEGKKFGSIKDTGGATYWVPAAMVSQFKPNSTVDVPVKSEKWGDSHVQVVAGHASPVATLQVTPVYTPRLPSNQTAPPPPPPTAYHAASSGVDKDALIFITGVVGRSMGSGKFTLTNITDLTEEAIKAWLFLKDQMR